MFIYKVEDCLLYREGNRLYSYLHNKVKSLPHNYTIYYLTPQEQMVYANNLDHILIFNVHFIMTYS